MYDFNCFYRLSGVVERRVMMCVGFDMRWIIYVCVKGFWDYKNRNSNSSFIIVIVSSFII